jgi:glycosyltransferase involved in cell wall biosynthesis
VYETDDPQLRGFGMTQDRTPDDDLDPPLRSDWVFIDWSAHCSRSENFARRVGMRLLRRHRPFNGPVSFVAKYAYQMVATSWDLVRERPSVVWCMSPTPLAILPAWVYCELTGGKLAIDAHTGAFEGSPWARLLPLQLFLSRRAKVTAITNAHLQSIVERGGGATLIVPDVPTEQEAPTRRDFGPGFHALYVASYSADEPFEIVLEAARRTPDVTFWLTGRPKGKAKALLESAPSNVKLLGFLSREDYLSALAGAHVVLALTTRDHTMQRAAYEAAYLGVPVIVSDWPILRENFDRGSIWVDNTGDSLERGIRHARERYEELAAGAQELKAIKLARWRRTRGHVLSLLAAEPSGSAQLGVEK